MKDKLIVVIVAAGLLAGCGRSAAARRNAQEYEVVQEGSAAGVTATIHGPGETVPPITDTNVDTTTAFTLNPNAAATAPTATTQPGTIAGTLPPPMPSAPPPMTSAPIPAAPRPVTPRPQPVPEPPTQTEPQPVPPPPPTQTEPEPEPVPPPTQTDTAPPPTQTETEEPPPPPPPPPVR